MPYQHIETELLSGILVLRQNRPEKLNARCSQMYVEIMAALNDASADSNVVAVLLTSKGKFFSAGMDFQNDAKLAYTALPDDDAAVIAVKTSLPKQDSTDVRTWPAVKFIEAFIDFDKPLFGAVNGPAIGEGFSSLLHCDLLYAADSAYFWSPFARAGVAPEFCSTVLMPQRLGRSLASAAMYLGQKITAVQAQSVGFVVEVLPAGEDFERVVLAKLQQGLELTGPESVRKDTLQSYRRLVYGASDRESLREQCYAEFELIRQRGIDGTTALVQAYFQSLLPGANS